jgi:hypothetical protein
MILLFLKGLFVFCGAAAIGLVLTFGVLYLAWVFSQRDNGW